MVRRYHNMGSSLALMIIIPLLLVPIASAITARQAVTCYNESWNDNTKMVTLADGECLDFNLGSLPPETILSIELSITGGAIDFLFFDQNGAQTYLLGQNYHLSLESNPTFENQSDSISYHWSTPNSLAEKQWHIIIDNSEHTGDEGLGDQGGESSEISINVSIIERDYYEVYHDMETLAPESHLEIAGGNQMTLDAGSSIAVTVWPIEGNPDLFLMSESQRENFLSGAQADTHISSASILQITTLQTLTWVVPQEYDGVTLYMMLDNKASPAGGGSGVNTAKISISVIVNPVLTASIEDNLTLAVAELGDTIEFSAENSPNRQSQIAVLEWDLDSAIDSDGDGDFTNDVDATGWVAEVVYTTPGVHTVSLKITSPRNETAFSSHQVTVVDTVAPQVSMSHNGVTDPDGNAMISHDQIITLTASSSDGHIVASVRWTVDGVLMSNESTLQKSWGSPSSHEIVLVVSDASGNEVTQNLTVLVVDGTFPAINRESCIVPVTATVGESIKLTGVATDAWDDDQTLLYHWDLDPLFDSNGDGDMRNDPDLSGATTGNVFTAEGEQTIVLNVRDESGNSDKMAFTIQVNPAPKAEDMFGMIVVIAVIFLITSVIGIIGYQKVQENVAMRMLAENGLTEIEAKQRIISVKSNQNLSIFSSASARAGLGQKSLKTAEQFELEEKRALSEELYGSTQDPNLAFQPQGGRQGAEAEIASLAGIGQVQTQSSGRVLSDDEFALMAGLDDNVQTSNQEPLSPEPQNEDLSFLQSLSSNETTTTPSESKRLGAVSSGIELPSTSQQSEIHPQTPSRELQMKAECSSCGKAMMFSFPEGVSEVLIDCPSCGIEQLVGR